MSRMMPPGVHSEFQVRMSLTVRAPEGGSQRAVLMRKLVEELKERNETGHLREWMIDALLDRVARDSLHDPALYAVVPDHLLEREAAGLKEAASQPVVGRGAGRDVQPSHEKVHAMDDSQQRPAATVSAALPSGLRVM